MSLAAGSIAFLGFNANGLDGFALLAIDDLPAGSVLRFSDNEWNGQPVGAGGAFNTGEGGFTWTLGAAIPAGTTIEFLHVSDAATRSVNLGTLSGGTLALGASAEAIYVFGGFYAEQLSPATLAALRCEPAVKVIEQNGRPSMP